MRSLFLAAGMVVLTACGQAGHPGGEDSAHTGHGQHKERSGGSEEQPQVALKTDPARAKAGETVEIRAVITQQGKPVNDAHSVRFEVWPAGDADAKRESLKGKRTGDGVYSAKKTFGEAGKYKVMYHVTARGSHVMNPETLTVRP